MDKSSLTVAAHLLLEVVSARLGMGHHQTHQQPRAWIDEIPQQMRIFLHNFNFGRSATLFLRPLRCVVARLFWKCRISLHNFSFGRSARLFLRLLGMLSPDSSGMLSLRFCGRFTAFWTVDSDGGIVSRSFTP